MTRRDVFDFGEGVCDGFALWKLRLQHVECLDTFSELAYKTWAAKWQKAPRKSCGPADKQWPAEKVCKVESPDHHTDGTSGD